ncbi:MAG: hypothetical protein Q9M13_06960 [Mariprofundales bacterium]|nr:hypothetical protein [Mariprofundales bacterium]
MDVLPQQERMAAVMAIGARQRLVVAGVVLLLLGGVAVWNSSSLVALYSSQQSGQVGWVLNGVVITLFFVGLFRLVVLLKMAWREEQSLAQALSLVPDNVDLLSTALPPRSVIGERIASMQQLHKRHQPVAHDVLAATLVASYSSSMTLPRFVNNSLILCGVFGTIVALSMALLGASNLLVAVDGGGMGLVIHGMSTALSTTMTAIVCYLYFTWLLHSVEDVHVRLLAAVEHFTLHHLLPLFHVDAESINHQLAELLLSMATLVEKMESERSLQPELIAEIAALRAQQMEMHEQQREDSARLATLVQQGFRLQ